MTNDWQPMSTAPKDGTKILGYDPIADAQVVICYDDIGWMVCWTAQENNDCTHWKPLGPSP